ncbi:MAG: 3'-5' exonuclease, partial [Anaerolineales bacterium]|nr:3'-5' exonuclease [Anaerolineales bacterium]
WTEIQQARAAQNWDEVLASLSALRKATSTQGKKDNWDDITTVREAMKDLREIYEDHLKFLAEKSRFSLDEQLAAHLPAVHRLLDQTVLEYQHRKDEKQSLDFDDLEGLTAQLLTAHPEVRAQLQSELRAVLVDEFQDTNDRQRQIVYALTGFNHQLPITNYQSSIENRKSEIVNLFIVGDSKQSIYRFRSADVTVFRQVQADIRDSGGELIDLDLTFRAHKPLLEQLNALLAPILGETDDPARPYAVPFAPLHAYRPSPVRENIQPPFIEFHLGMGESADEGRAASAQALASRLRELHQNEGFAWGDMALLFRSSTAYAVYESALEAASIPFVTIAGRGFYDRPEIRDLLNILAAIADPTDDLALVGALRSPAFALLDAEIYKLRYPDNATSPVKLFDSLKRNAEQVDKYTSTHAQADNGTRNTPVLSSVEGQHAEDSPIHPSSFILHPFNILTDLHALSSRAPAAAILKRLLDLTHYRAILTSDPNGARSIRNVEKLLADAHRSRLVSLTDFLAYVQTLRDVGLREGEAPADSSNAGAVQLMTVHKAKGLEFPLTVLADAAYEHRGAGAKIQLADTLLLDLRDDDFHSTAWQLAARLEDDRAEAEDARLLYVAATRAKEKLLVSGHVKLKKDGTFSLSGWLSKFSFLEMTTPEHFPINDGIYAAVYPYSQTDEPIAPQPDSTPQTESPRESDLLKPLVPNIPLIEEKLRARESDPPQRVWRIVSKAKTPRAPAWLVGRLVHEAIHRWHFPDDNFEDFLKPFALESGLTDEAEIHAAIQESRRLLERLHAHPLFTELDSAERHHEVRYDLPDGRGIMDLLYRTEAGWFIIDFKTDEVRSESEAQSAISQNGYDRQVARYAEAIENQLKVKTKTRLVFLNMNGEVKIYP